MHLSSYIGAQRNAEEQFADALEEMAKRHAEHLDVANLSKECAKWSAAHAEALKPFADRYGEVKVLEPTILRGAIFKGIRPGQLKLLRDFEDLMLMARMVEGNWTVISQASKALRDKELEEVCDNCGAETHRQIEWIATRIKSMAAQTLIAAP